MTVFQYDSTFEGLLTALFDAYYRRTFPDLLLTEKEPLPMDSPLYTLDNVILTPHTAASTEQFVLRCCETVADDICAVINGQDAKFAANKF